MNNNATELISRGMQCLREGLGDVESEEFIAIILREKFDYTQWQKTLYDGMSAEEIVNKAATIEAIS